MPSLTPKFWAWAHLNYPRKNETKPDKYRWNLLRKAKNATRDVTTDTQQNQRKSEDLLSSSQAEGSETFTPPIRPLLTPSSTTREQASGANHPQENSQDSSPPGTNITCVDVPLEDNTNIYHASNVFPKEARLNGDDLVEAQPGLWGVISLESGEYLVYFKKRLFTESRISETLALKPGEVKLIDIGNSVPEIGSHRTLFIGTSHFLVRIAENEKPQPDVCVVLNDARSIVASHLENHSNQSTDVLLLRQARQDGQRPTQERLDSAIDIIDCVRMDLQEDQRSEGGADTSSSIVESYGSERPRRLAAALGTPEPSDPSCVQEDGLENIRGGTQSDIPTGIATEISGSQFAQEPVSLPTIPDIAESRLRQNTGSYGEILDEVPDAGPEREYLDQRNDTSAPQGDITDEGALRRLEDELDRCTAISNEELGSVASIEGSDVSERKTERPNEQEDCAEALLVNHSRRVIHQDSDAVRFLNGLVCEASNYDKVLHEARLEDPQYDALEQGFQEHITSGNEDITPEWRPFEIMEKLLWNAPERCGMDYDTFIAISQASVDPIARWNPLAYFQSRSEYDAPLESPPIAPEVPSHKRNIYIETRFAARNPEELRYILDDYRRHVHRLDLNEVELQDWLRYLRQWCSRVFDEDEAIYKLVVPFPIIAPVPIRATPLL